MSGYFKTRNLSLDGDPLEQKLETAMHYMGVALGILDELNFDVEANHLDLALQLVRDRIQAHTGEN